MNRFWWKFIWMLILYCKNAIFLFNGVGPHWRPHKVVFLFKNPLFFDIPFVWNLILTKFGMNAYIIKTQFFHNIKFDLIGHEGHFFCEKVLWFFIDFFICFFCFKYDLTKIWYECYDANFWLYQDLAYNDIDLRSYGF